jgi:DNA-binding MarR family transcriptional regulator
MLVVINIANTSIESHSLTGREFKDKLWWDHMGKQSNGSLDRDQQILNRLARIEHKVDSLEQTTAFALRAESEKHFNSVKEIFKRGKRKAQIYLAIDGQRSVQEIAKHLSMKRQNVTPELRTLVEEGLIEVIDSNGGKDIYGRKPVDRTLRIAKFLQGEFDLSSDGLLSHKRKKKSTSR